MATNMFYLVKILTLAVGFRQLEASATAYCDSEICSGPDKYCCGHNECCTYGYTIWYIWLALIGGIVILGFVIWKYLINKRRLISKNDMMQTRETHHRSQSSNAKNLASSSSAQPYMPLSNNDVFVENQLDENTFQFNLVHPKKPLDDSNAKFNRSNEPINKNSYFKTY